MFRLVTTRRQMFLRFFFVHPPPKKSRHARHVCIQIIIRRVKRF